MASHKPILSEDMTAGLPTPPATTKNSRASSPSKTNRFHAKIVTESWRLLQSLRGKGVVALDGESLEIATVVAVSRYFLLSQLLPQYPSLLPFPDTV